MRACEKGFRTVEIDQSELAGINSHFGGINQDQGSRLDSPDFTDEILGHNSTVDADPAGFAIDQFRHEKPDRIIAFQLVPDPQNEFYLPAWIASTSEFTFRIRFVKISHGLSSISTTP